MRLNAFATTPPGTTQRRQSRRRRATGDRLRITTPRTSTRPLHRARSQFDAVVGGVHEILLRAEVPFGRLDGCVAQEQLNLLKLATRGAPSFPGRRPPLMRRA